MSSANNIYLYCPFPMTASTIEAKEIKYYNGKTPLDLGLTAWYSFCLWGGGAYPLEGQGFWERFSFSIRKIDLPISMPFPCLFGFFFFLEWSLKALCYSEVKPRELHRCQSRVLSRLNHGKTAQQNQITERKMSLYILTHHQSDFL